MKNKDIEFYYKYVGMNLEQFALFEEKFHSESSFEMNSEMQFSYDIAKRILSCKISVVLSQEKEIFLKAILDSHFLIKEESVNQLIQDNELIIPIDLLIQFASLNYGSLRGVIYAKSINTKLNSVIIPPVFLQDVIKKPLHVKL